MNGRRFNQQLGSGRLTVATFVQVQAGGAIAVAARAQTTARARGITFSPIFRGRLDEDIE
jgi:hypothetical protein